MENIITITDDFDLNKIINSGQCFRPLRLSSGDCRFIFNDKILYIREVTDNTYQISCSLKEWEDFWADYFDLETDYKAIRSSIPKDDTYMLNASKLGAGIRILRQDPFEMIISFIISQRKNIPAIRSSVEKICSFYGQKISTDREEVYLFPTVKDLYDKGFMKLSECSLGYRLPYITSTIEAILDGSFDIKNAPSLDDEALLNSLMSLHGVGIKVASCVALFAYHRGAIAPVDTWIKRVIEQEYNGVSPFPGYGANGGIFQQYAFYMATQN